MDGLTHIAAILLGVFLTFLFARSFQKKNYLPADTDIPPTVSRSTLRKKKKKKKAKAVAAAAANSDVAVKDSENLRKSAVAPDESPKTTVKKKKKKKSTDEKLSSEAVSEEKKVETIEKREVVSFTTSQQQIARNVEAPKPNKKREEEEWGVVARPKKRKPKQKKAVEKINTATAPILAASESLTVDARKIGVIIGPKGTTMKALEEATGCKLDINAPSKDDQPVKTSRQQKAGVIISGGDKEGITKAKKAILELASKGYATILQSENFGEFGSMVHPRCLSEIVGPGGKTIQAIQSEFDVKLTIPSTDWKPNSGQVGQVKTCTVGIAGTKENAKQAKAVIQSIVKYHHHEVTHPGLIHEQFHVPQEFFHCVIGPRGSEIKHIRGNFRVDIYIPNEDSFTDDILVVGKQNNVDRAISYIQTLIDRDTEQREMRYNDEYY